MTEASLSASAEISSGSGYLRHHAAKRNAPVRVRFIREKLEALMAKLDADRIVAFRVNNAFGISFDEQMPVSVIRIGNRHTDGFILLIRSRADTGDIIDHVQESKRERRTRKNQNAAACSDQQSARADPAAGMPPECAVCA